MYNNRFSNVSDNGKKGQIADIFIHSYPQTAFFIHFL